VYARQCHRLGHHEEDCTLLRVLQRGLPGYVPIPPPPRGDGSPPPPPPPPPRRAAQPPPPPSLRWDPQRRDSSCPSIASAVSGPSLVAAPTASGFSRASARQPPAAGPSGSSTPQRDGVHRGATGSRPRQGRERLATGAPQDLPPRSDREGRGSTAAVGSAQPSAAASGAEAGPASMVVYPQTSPPLHRWVTPPCGCSQRHASFLAQWRLRRMRSRSNALWSLWSLVLGRC
jgi:hypothetical protein